MGRDISLPYIELDLCTRKVLLATEDLLLPAVVQVQALLQQQGEELNHLDIQNLLGIEDSTEDWAI